MAAIRNIPYVNFVRVAPDDRGKKGVTTLDPERVEQGYVLFVPKPRYEALLVDVKGDVVHRWASGTGRLPDAQTARWPDFLAGWQTVSMVRNGDLFAILGRHAVLKLDWNSRVVWMTALPAHHDVAVAGNGDIYVLTEGVRVVESGGRKRAVLDDGNVLVFDNGFSRNRSRVLEVDPGEKTIVWEYLNPFFDESGLRRSGVYRTHFVTPETAAPLLARR